VLVEQCLAASVRPPQRLVLDCDATEAPVHGEQEQARDEGDYGGDGGLPLPLSAGLSGRLLPTLCKAKRFPGAQRLAVLTRLVKRLRPAWPPTRLLLRGDRHLASPEARPWIEEPPALREVTGLPSHRVVTELARAVVEQAKRAYARDGGTIPRFHATRSQAGTWSRWRRVVIKVEVSAQGVNPRLGVTDMEPARTKGLSQPIDGARGQAENARKDHQRSLTSDRTSWPRFEANPFRLLLHSAASV
jgi:hypothetical protein